MKVITTIKTSKETVLGLSRLKIHPRQSYEEVIVKLVREYGKDISSKSAKAKTSSPTTTIKISKKTVGELSALKIHPRQSYEEIIVKLLARYKQGK